MIQFAAPHAYLSTATGVAFAARAIGGAFGSAVLDAIVSSYLSSHLASSIVGALPSSVSSNATAATEIVAGIAGGDPAVLASLEPAAAGQVMSVVRHVYAGAYRRAWAAIVPFVVLATICIVFLRGVGELMTERVEASVEKGEGADAIEGAKA